MSEYFIQKLFIKDVRGIIKDLEIPLSETERKHLIITGKNGSGKTSLLNEIDILLNKLINNQFAQIKQLENSIKSHNQAIEHTNKNIESYKKQIDDLETQKNSANIQQIEANIRSFQQNILNEKNNIKNWKQHIINWQKQLNDFSKIDLVFSHQSEIYENIVNGKFILAFFKAKRENKANPVQNPTKQNFQQKYMTNAELNKTFLQYLVNLKTSQAFAQIENNIKEVEHIAKWFERFENALKEIFDEKELKMVFNHKNFDFKIEYDNRSFGLNQLSHGYSSFLAILTELILRMEAHSVEVYDMQGVVLVDEIETHLHVELQKKVLPFLTNFFPKIQFIVTTHSPFVLSSIENAVICDLERREVIDSERFKNASYSQIVKNYFQVDSEFSRVLVADIERYEDLITLFENGKLDERQEKELFDLDLKLDKISPMLSDEIYLRFKDAQERIQNNG